MALTDHMNVACSSRNFFTWPHHFRPLLPASIFYQPFPFPTVATKEPVHSAVPTPVGTYAPGDKYRDFLDRRQPRLPGNLHTAPIPAFRCPGSGLVWPSASG